MSETKFILLHLTPQEELQRLWPSYYWHAGIKPRHERVVLGKADVPVFKTSLTTLCPENASLFQETEESLEGSTFDVDLDMWKQHCLATIQREEERERLEAREKKKLEPEYSFRKLLKDLIDQVPTDRLLDLYKYIYDRFVPEQRKIAARA